MLGPRTAQQPRGSWAKNKAEAELHAVSHREGRPLDDPNEAGALLERHRSTVFRVRDNLMSGGIWA